MKPLTDSQREALLVADARDPLPVYVGTTNDKAFVKPGAARTLTDRGFLAPISTIPNALRITVRGRQAATTLRKETSR